jgi:hypothetical protein
MSPQSEATFKLFSINSGPFAQRAYAICTAFRNPGGHLKSECFVLIQSSPTDGVAFGSRFTYGDNTDRNAPVVIDEAFAMDDALHQAETMYSVRARELDPGLSEKLGGSCPVFSEIPVHRLVGIWAHTPLSASLLIVADKSNCAALTQFVSSLRSLPTIKQTPLAL